jgi:transcriptional regulator with XRE-family HTH domain
LSRNWGQMIKSTNNQSYQKLIAWLKKSRLERGLTVRQLGELLDEPFQFVSKIENGQRNLSVHEYVQYCEALGAEPEIGLRYLSKKKQ